MKGTGFSPYISSLESGGLYWLDKANKMNGALAPADALSAKSLEIEPFSAACSGR
jgi:hypothetical protein